MQLFFSLMEWGWVEWRRVKFEFAKEFYLYMKYIVFQEKYIQILNM